MPGGRHGLDRRGRREQRSRDAAEAERAAQVARAERRLAQATSSLPLGRRPEARTPAAPMPRPETRPRPVVPGPPLAPAPRAPLPVSGDLYIDQTPTDGLSGLRTERTLPPNTWLSFHG